MRRITRPSHLIGWALASCLVVAPAPAAAASVTPLASCPAVQTPTVGSLSVPVLVNANFNRQLGSLSGNVTFVVRATPTTAPGATVVSVRVIDVATGKHQLGSSVEVPRSLGCGRVTLALQDLDLLGDYLKLRKLYAVRAVIQGQRSTGLDAFLRGGTGFFVTY